VLTEKGIEEQGCTGSCWRPRIYAKLYAMYAGEE
jgi:hypothetical protein